MIYHIENRTTVELSLVDRVAPFRIIYTRIPTREVTHGKGKESPSSNHRKLYMAKVKKASYPGKTEQ